MGSWDAHESTGAPGRLGSVPSGYGYYPYGEAYQTPTTDGDNFATYFRDTETGLDYAQNRYYFSILGRFLTPDPSAWNVKLGNPSTITDVRTATAIQSTTTTPTDSITDAIQQIRSAKACPVARLWDSLRN